MTSDPPPPGRKRISIRRLLRTLGPGLISFYIALALVGWVSYARLIRSRFIVLKHADFVMAARLIETMRRGFVPDIDVYDAAAWSAPGPLSVASVAQGSTPQPFPDFTRGLWKSKRANM